MSDEFDRLDSLALRVASGDLECAGCLSRGEYLYVALAANSHVLLARRNDTIAEAIARLGDDWTAELVQRWQYRGNPQVQSQQSTQALNLNLSQLTLLQSLVDAAASKEGNPDAEVFGLLDLVRAARKQAAWA